MSTATVSPVFKTGKYSVNLLIISQEDIDKWSSASAPPPPKPLLISSPTEEGEFPVLIFLHGTLLYNSFYSQLLRHISSHGFIVVAPQLYICTGTDSTKDIYNAAKTTDWLPIGLAQILPNHVQPNLSKLAIAGHSRGGKVAVALALGTYATTSLPFSALLAVDPVDGTAKEKQTNPPILTYIPHSFELKMAALVIGSGLGQKKTLLFSPCAPNGVSHQEFFNECNPPACHLVARDYGHMDTLDDGTNGIRGMATHCMCANGKSREPMRNFVGGVMVAFMRAYLEGQKQDLLYLRDNPDSAFPLVVSIASFQLE